MASTQIESIKSCEKKMTGDPNRELNPASSGLSSVPLPLLYCERRSFRYLGQGCAENVVKNVQSGGQIGRIGIGEKRYHRQG